MESDTKEDAFNRTLHVALCLDCWRGTVTGDAQHHVTAQHIGGCGECGAGSAKLEVRCPPGCESARLQAFNEGVEKAAELILAHQKEGWLCGMDETVADIRALKKTEGE